jgi:hypothetical protein
MSNSAIINQLDFYSAADTGSGVDVSREDLEQWVALGLFLYERVMDIDRRWSTDPQRIPAAEVQALYRRWHAASEHFLPLIRRLEAAGETLCAAEEFRKAMAFASIQASWDLERIVKSVRQVEQGRTRPMAEVMDELRRRVHR